MTEQKRKYWIDRITGELKRNNEPIWYDANLIKELNYFKIIEIDLNHMALITFRA